MIGRKQNQKTPRVKKTTSAALSQRKQSRAGREMGQTTSPHRGPGQRGPVVEAEFEVEVNLEAEEEKAKALGSHVASQEVSRPSRP